MVNCFLPFSCCLDVMHCFHQDRASRACLISTKSRTVDACQSIRLTKVDPSNEPMRHTSEELALYYAKMLDGTARQAFNLNAGSSTSSTPTLELQCAHDCIVDPSTNERIDHTSLLIVSACAFTSLTPWSKAKSRIVNPNCMWS